MKQYMRNFILGLGLLSTLNLQPSTAIAQGTAFTYQGRLNDGANPANGFYDLRFTLWNAESGGFLVSGTTGVNALPVSNGLFTVTLDFGPGIFTGADRWLEIAVRTNGGSSFATLSPRQKLTSTPYAVRALEAGDVLNPVPDALIPPTVARLGGSNVFTGQVSFVVPPRWEGPPFTVNTAAQVPNLNADYLDGFDSGAFWKIIGNADTSPDVHFLGTTDNQPLELRANNQPVLRLAYGYGNTNTGFAAAIPGGYFNSTAASFSFAAGRRARANHEGSLVWADSTQYVLTNSLLSGSRLFRLKSN